MAFSLLRPIESIRSLAASIPRPSTRVASVLEREKEMLEESRLNVGKNKVRAAWGNNSVFQTYWWLPYHDSITGETAAMRGAYRQMLRCPSVKSALVGKVIAGASLDWQIQPKNPDSPRDLECCDFLRHCIDRIPGGMPQLFQTLTLQRLIDGYSLSEPVLEIERNDPKWNGKIVLHDVKPKHPDHYLIATDEFANPFAVEGRGPNQGDVWSLSDFIYSRYIPLYDDPRGTSDLRAAYGAYFMRDTVTKLRAIGAEKWTNPFLMGTYTKPDEKVNAEAAMKQAKGNTWISIPEGVKIEAMSIASRGESDFKSFIDDCDKQIIVGISGAYLQVLEGQVSDGRGSSSVSKSISELFQWLLLVLVQEDVNKFLFPRLVGYNYLGVGTPKLLMGGIGEDEVGKVLDNILKAQQAGVEVSKKDTYRRIAFAMPDGPDDVLKPMAQGGFNTGTSIGGFTLPSWNDPSPAPAPEPTQSPAPAKQDATPPASSGPAPAKEDPASVPLPNTVGGATSLTAIQTAFYANEIPREAAIATATTVFKLSPEEAEKLFPPQTPETQAKADAATSGGSK